MFQALAILLDVLVPRQWGNSLNASTHIYLQWPNYLNINSVDKTKHLFMLVVAPFFFLPLGSYDTSMFFPVNYPHHSTSQQTDAATNSGNNGNCTAKTVCLIIIYHRSTYGTGFVM